MSYEFVTDAMLGDLAKWLRILGRSTYYEPYAEDERLLAVAKEHRAVLLTRDRLLYERATGEGVKAAYLGGVELGEALALLSRGYGVRLEVSLSDTRCPTCNERLRPAEREEVRGRVPEAIVGSYGTFLVCEGCKRVYWPGSHLRRMTAFLEDIRRLTAQG